MIKKHLSAVMELAEAVEGLHKLAEGLPDGIEKYRLIALIEIMERTVADYADQSADMYDGILRFAMAVAN